MSAPVMSARGWFGGGRATGSVGSSGGSESTTEMGVASANYPLRQATVFFATNRVRRTATGFIRWLLRLLRIRGDSDYGSRRAEMLYGTAQIGIPKRHRRGNIERPKLWKVEFSEDAKRHVVVTQQTLQDEGTWFSAVSKKLEDQEPQILVYVHGYRVGFEDALRRTGQLAFDLDFAGAAVCFAWPSMGKVLRYDADKVRAQQSVPDLAALLQRLMDETGVRQFHVVAHSMGNLVLSGALALLDSEDETLFNNIVLSSPDLDATVFREQIAPRITRQADRVTMYASSDDFALTISGLVQAATRAGRMSPKDPIAEGVDVIDVSDVKAGLLEHSHLHESSDVLMDLFMLYKHGLGPEERNLQLVEAETASYWYMPRQ